jgi:hypothetical protein
MRCFADVGDCNPASSGLELPDLPDQPLKTVAVLAI